MRSAVPSRRGLLRAASVLLALLPWAGTSHAAAQDPVRVVCTIPDLADAVRIVGGEHVQVHSLARGTEDVHQVRIRPSDLNQTARADMFVEMGLSLEHAFVPGLLLNARNPKVQPDQPGFLNCSEGWDPINVPERVSRSDAADLHPFGNPHFNLDPRGGRHIADRVLEGLLRVAPKHAEDFRASHAAYVERLKAAEARWTELAKGFQGRKVVTYHQDFDYLLRSLGVERFGTVEPKPGVPPTPRDLAALVAAMKKEEVDTILTAPWSNVRSVRFVAEKTGAKVVVLPAMVGATKEADSWIAMMDLVHTRLSKALSR